MKCSPWDKSRKRGINLKRTFPAKQSYQELTICYIKSAKISNKDAAGLCSNSLSVQGRWLKYKLESELESLSPPVHANVQVHQNQMSPDVHMSTIGQTCSSPLNFGSNAWLTRLHCKPVARVDQGFAVHDIYEVY